MTAKYDTELLTHLNTPLMRNATYMSPSTQNEIMSIIANDYIMTDLMAEVQEARWFSVMADEVCSHNKEILAVCIRFVDRENNIREEFLSFTKVDRITGEVLAAEIKTIIEKKGLEMRNLERASVQRSSKHGI